MGDEGMTDHHSRTTSNLERKKRKIREGKEAGRKTWRVRCETEER